MSGRNFFCPLRDTGKPVVWIYTDMSDKTIPGPNKEGTVNDPDDISAMAGYLLLADCFDTRGIVVASTTGNSMLRLATRQSGRSVSLVRLMRLM